jgi:hypothetical protein
MAFRHISIVLADVMAGVERAAAATNSAAGFEGGLPKGLDDNPPMLSAEGNASNGMRKEAGAVEAPASSDREELRRTSEEIRAGDTHRTHARPALRLVTGNRCNPTRSPSGSPTRRVGFHLVLVDCHSTASGAF